MRSPVPLMRRYAPELYFFFYNAAIVFILPFLGILWKEEGFSGSQIGILSAVRPFICSVSGQLLVGMADARRWHFGITLTTFVITAAARSSMALLHGFAAHVLLVAVSEAAQSPFSIMTDAAIAASTDQAGYGRKRVLASLGWGALAPLSGWIVGQYGVPRSIAVYFALVVCALVPTVLLPLRELGRKRSLGQEVAAPPSSAARKKGAGELACTSANALLLPQDAMHSDHATVELDSRQHNGHAAELAIELLGASRPPAAAMAADADAMLVERLVSKLSQASQATAGAVAAQQTPPTVMLGPLLTTADEDAAAEEASAASPPYAPPAAESSWSIAAVGSPLAMPQASLTPIACLAAEPGGAMLSPHPGGSASDWNGPSSALARTTSAATTTFWSARSDSSFSASQVSPRSGGNVPAGPMPRSTLLARLTETGSLAAAVAATRRTAGGDTGSKPGSLHGSLHGSAPAQHPPRALFRQPSDLASVAATQSFTPQATPQPQAAALLSQASNLSQALNGFDLSFHEGSLAGGLAGQAQLQRSPQAPEALPDAQHLLPPPQQLPQLSRQASILSQALNGLDLEGSVSAARAAKRPRPVLSLTADSSTPKAPLPAVAIQVGGRPGPEPAAVGGAADGPSVWAGVKALLRNPHHAAFFATALLMGVGYGALGYEQLYLKEQGAPGILLGMGLLVGTCVGEVAMFSTQGWWLKKLGMELAFNIGMVGWVLRLGLLTLLPYFPSLWCILPVDLLQGMTFGMAYGTGTVRAQAIAPPHLRSTVQSLFFCLYYGVGPGISGLSGGIIYQRMGMRYVFIVFSCVLAVGWAAVLLWLRWATRDERRQRRLAAQVVL